jgi:hypothetical protein
MEMVSLVGRLMEDSNQNLAEVGPKLLTLDSSPLQKIDKVYNRPFIIGLTHKEGK